MTNNTMPMDVDDKMNSANKEESNFTSTSLYTPANQSEYDNNNNTHNPDKPAQTLESNSNFYQQNEEYGGNNNTNPQPDLYAQNLENNSNFSSTNQYGCNNNIPYSNSNPPESNSSMNRQDEVDFIRTKLQETFNKNGELEAEILSLKTKLRDSEENCKLFEEALSAKTVDQQSADELYQKIDKQELKIKEQGDKLTTYQGLFDRLKIENKELQQKSEHFESQCSKLEQQLNDKRSQIQSLRKKNNELEDEASNYQSALGVAKNFKMSDDDKNHNFQLNEDILSLQDKIDEYVTNLVKTKVDVKIDEIMKLLPHYECQTKIDLKKPDKQFLKAILQRHVLETIFGFAKYYFIRHKKDYYLESDIVKRTEKLFGLMKKFACTRDGTDEITNDTPIRLRQLIYTALGMRGFGDIIESNQLYFHNSIESFTAKLNDSMNQYRIVTDPKKKEYIDELAEVIIREVFRIFYFRLKIQEPIAQYHWFKFGDKANKTSMKANWDEDETDDLVVELCTFPLIYQNIDSKWKIFTLAKVFTRHVPKPSLKEKFQNVIKSVTKSKSSKDNLDQSTESPNNNSTKQDEQEQDTTMSPTSPTHITNDNSTESHADDTETGQNYSQESKMPEAPEVPEEKNEENLQ